MRAYDPHAGPKMATACPDATYLDSPYDAATGCDAIILATEWDEFLALDLDKLRSVTAGPLFIDGRGVLDPADLRRAGFHLDEMHQAPSTQRERASTGEMAVPE